MSETEQRSRSPSLELPASTLAALQEFYKEEQQKQADLEAFKKSSSSDKPISVQDFLRLFGPDWQQSQFWYSDAFSKQLSIALHSLCDQLAQPDASQKIAFLCCPTAYVGFQHHSQHPGARLLEYDHRFESFAGSAYTHYNLYEPEANLPEELIGSVDVAVCDPPFLNAATNECIAKTLRRLLRPDGKVVLLTSTSVAHLLPTIYDAPPIGPLYETKIQVEHAGGISNEFAVWTNWSKDWSLEQA